ncbi:hypothetical protein SFRURICE_012686, partial [Spodoptera frugiperda]
SDRERDRGRPNDGIRRGLLGDRPDDREKVPSLLDVKPYGCEIPPPMDRRSHDARDAVSPRFIDRERRDKERDREREHSEIDNILNQVSDEEESCSEFEDHVENAHSSDSSSCESESAVVPAEGLFSKNGEIIYLETPFGSSCARTSRENIINMMPGLTRYSSSRITEEEISSFELFFPPPLIHIILNYTNIEGRHRRDRSRSSSRGAQYGPGHSSDRRSSPPGGDYRPSSYKVNRKLEVMEKMGLQIKTPDGSMATAQQLRAAASEVPTQGSHLPSYYNPTAVNANKIMDQVQKRKLLWSNKNKSEAEEAAKWSGTRFAQDSDGKQVSKFMRLMGIKEPAAVKNEAPEKAVDPIKKQEELFQAMQAQYEVARATTHTMRGVGLGFQRGQY